MLLYYLLSLSSTIVSYVIICYVIVVCRVSHPCLDYRISFPWLSCSLSLSVACFLIFPYRSLDRPFPYPYPGLAWRRAKTLLRPGLTLLDFSHFLLLGCLARRAWRGQNLVLTCLDFASFVHFFAMALLDFMRGEGRKPCSDLSWPCLTSCVAKGENLVQTWLDFAWFSLFYCWRKPWFDVWWRVKTLFRRGLIFVVFGWLCRLITVDFVWGDTWARVKTLFRLCLTLLDLCRFFCYGIAWFCLVWTKPCSQFAWLCFIFAGFHVWRGAKTSFWPVFALLYFRIFDYIDGWGDDGGEYKTSFG